MHVDETVLTPLRIRYGVPRTLEWEGEISEREHRVMMGSSGGARRHDVTLFILNGDRLALIRKPHFEPGLWRTPGGGIKPGEDFVEGAKREALEETGLDVELERYLVRTSARFDFDGESTLWSTHVFLATTQDEAIAPRDTEEVAEARWGTLDELAGPVRGALLGTGRAFWRYRVALHDLAIEQLRGGG